MPATLQQIQARLEQAQALRDDAALVMQDFIADATGSISPEMRARREARLNGYQREVELLMKIERDLVANGRAAKNDLRILSGFDASRPIPAAVTPSHSSDAQMAPREAPRNEASATPLPASGDVF